MYNGGMTTTLSEPQVHATTLTALGWVATAASAAGVTAVTLPQLDEQSALAMVERSAGSSQRDTAGQLDSLLDRLRRYYASEDVALDDVLDMRRGTPFQQRVWQAARRVPRGTTTTYGELARAVGAGPASARAVGRCMALNPWPPLVPCHRVLGKDGHLTGFAGGLAVKQQMLEMEGALLSLSGTD